MQTVILFYKYITIQYPKRILKWQKKIGTDLGLKGRILIAEEGINGTLSGSEKAIQTYVNILKCNELFSDMPFKYSTAKKACFPKLQVTIRPEIVALSRDKDAAPISLTGKHLSPDQTHELLQKKPADLIVLDVRNDFESAIGTFKDAVKAPIKHFRDLPKYIDKSLDKFKDKKVLMFCTGGVRCERATAYLNKKSVASEIYQIDGGIHEYAQKYPNGFFRGKNYVFDSRLAITVNDDILGSCLLCKQACSEYTNCINALCNKHFICCSTCEKQYMGSCSAKCNQKIKNNEVAARPNLEKI